MAKSLFDRRRSAFLQIAGFAGGNLVFSGAPKPGVEIPTHIVLTAADFVMCATIHQDYFGDEMSQADIAEILGDAGLLIIIAGGGGYAVAKGASGIIAEFTNFLGPLGWAASGLLAAGGTVLLGMIWMAICDYAYREGVSMKQAAKAIA